MSSCSSISSIQFPEASTSCSSKNLASLPIFKPIKKIVPEMDRFAKRRKNKDDLIDHDLAEASSAISSAVKFHHNCVMKSVKQMDTCLL